MRTSKDLFDDQKRAIMDMCSHDQMALFGGLGTGKTCISLYTIQRRLALGQIKRVLVFAPIRVCYGTWQDEADEWEYTKSLADKMVIIHGSNKKGVLARELSLDEKVIYLCNYESVQWMCDMMRIYKSKYKKDMFDTLILDESSKMKSWKTKRFKELKNLLKYFRYRYILTATPNPNSYLDLWSQFYVVNLGKSLYETVGRYQARYFTKVSTYVHVPASKDHVREIEKAIAPYTIRISADARPVPPLVLNPIKTELPHMEMYQEFEEEYFLEIDEVGIEAFNQASLAIKLRQFVQGAFYYEKEGQRFIKRVHEHKVDVIEDVMEAEPDKNFLIAIQFRFEMELLRKRFPGIKFIVGGTSGSDAQELIKQWNQGKVKHICCHPLSLSHGVNMQAGGHHIIWAGLPWSLEQFQQLNGRLHRMGQKEKTMAHCIIARNTIDEAVYNSLGRKDSDQKSLLNSLETYYRKKHGLLPTTR